MNYNSNKKKLLIFLYTYRFSKIDWDRFEINCFKNQYEVVVHDLLDIIHPGYNIGFKNNYNKDEILRFTKFFDWAINLIKLVVKFKKENINVVTNLSYETITEKLILCFLTIFRFKVVNFYVPGVAVPKALPKKLSISTKN